MNYWRLMNVFVSGWISSVVKLDGCHAGDLGSNPGSDGLNKDLKKLSSDRRPVVGIIIGLTQVGTG